MTLLSSPNLSCFSYNPTIRQTTVISVTCSASKKIIRDLPKNTRKYCSCCPRRHFFGPMLGAVLLPTLPLFASENDSQDSMTTLNRIRPPRADWYEELYASALDKFTKPYEAEIAVYKSELFAKLKGKAEKILEIGVGTGPNLKYYAENPDIVVFGVDPNRKMEKYAQAAAASAGLPPSDFRFMQAVAEALPVEDASVDAVVGTLVLCSVSDVDQTLQEVMRVLKPGGMYIFIEHVAAKDGTLLRFVQGILDPLQQAVADGCHLTLPTATSITKAGFAGVDVNQAALSSASFTNPHIYGIAYK